MIISSEPVRLTLRDRTFTLARFDPSLMSTGKASGDPTDAVRALIDVSMVEGSTDEDYQALDAMPAADIDELARQYLEHKGYTSIFTENGKPPCEVTLETGETYSERLLSIIKKQQQAYEENEQSAREALRKMGRPYDLLATRYDDLRERIEALQVPDPNAFMYEYSHPELPDFTTVDERLAPYFEEIREALEAQIRALEKQIIFQASSASMLKDLAALVGDGLTASQVNYASSDRLAKAAIWISGGALLVSVIQIALAFVR